MKKLLLIVAALCLTFTLSAQKTTNVIYLKNGSVLKGNIIEEAESRVKIALKDGSVFAYDLSEIERMEVVEKTTVFDFKTPAEHKWSIAPSAGYLYSSTMWVNSEGSSRQSTYVRASGKHGFTVGAVGEYYFSEGFGVSAGLKFALSGVKFNDSTEVGSIGNTGMDFTRYTIDIPLMANFYLGKSRMWYIQGGFNTSILVSGKTEVGEWWTTVGERTPGYILAPVNVQFVLGAGYGPVSIQLYGGITSMWTGAFRRDINNRLYNKTVSYSAPIGVSVSYTHKFKF